MKVDTAFKNGYRLPGYHFTTLMDTILELNKVVVRYILWFGLLCHVIVLYHVFFL